MKVTFSERLLLIPFLFIVLSEGGEFDSTWPFLSCVFFFFFLTFYPQREASADMLYKYMFACHSLCVLQELLHSFSNQIVHRWKIRDFEPFIMPDEEHRRESQQKSWKSGDISATAPTVTRFNLPSVKISLALHGLNKI